MGDFLGFSWARYDGLSVMRGGRGGSRKFVVAWAGCCFAAGAGRAEALDQQYSLSGRLHPVRADRVPRVQRVELRLGGRPLLHRKVEHRGPRVGDAQSVVPVAKEPCEKVEGVRG